MDEVDRRVPERRERAGSLALLRVYMKGVRIGYEGYPGVAPSKLDVREMVLSPACRFTFDPNNPTKLISVQLIEGPGVYLRLAELNAIEIIDYWQSDCAKLQSPSKLQPPN
jgi:hypothetical protein